MVSAAALEYGLVWFVFNIVASLVLSSHAVGLGMVTVAPLIKACDASSDHDWESGKWSELSMSGDLDSRWKKRVSASSRSVQMIGESFPVSSLTGSARKT
ncbi:hypothetical protein F5Y06DRAFT_86004 [Hypoxylon sp. FL0890]|nr:hypothetical protein F5Y06DRAFT_86004 [Hypoxylon sp. FL0890]